MDPIRLCRPKRRKVPLGLTMVEIIVVVGIISILVGLLVPALGSFRASARKTAEMTAARQLIVAYQSYADLNRGFLLPGYKTGLKARDRNHKSIDELDVPLPTAARYPWRLAPYLDYQFRSLYLDEQERMLAELETLDYETYVYLVGLYPSLGLNATWLGGNQNQLGFNDLALDAYGMFYARRLTEVQRTDQVLVFASARGPGEVPPSGAGRELFARVLEGYHEVRSPWLTASGGDRWADEFRSGLEPGEFGYLSLRHEGEVVAAFVDGHTGALSETELRDMRHWAPQADREDWALVNGG